MNPRSLTAEEEEELHTLQRYVTTTTPTHTGTAAAASSGADLTADIPLYALPDQTYLEQTVMPLLLRGLEELAVARPGDPLAFLGAYLLSNNPQPRPAATTAAAANAEPATVSASTPADGAEEGGEEHGNGTRAPAAAPTGVVEDKRLFHGVADRTEVAAIAADRFAHRAE